MENSSSGPTRTRRGPYRKYLRDLNAPLPKTTLWRLRKEKQQSVLGGDSESEHGDEADHIHDLEDHSGGEIDHDQEGDTDHSGGEIDLDQEGDTDHSGGNDQEGEFDQSSEEMDHDEDSESNEDGVGAVINEDLFQPIYKGAAITVCGAYCAIMEFKRVCRLPFTTIAMLLQLLQLLCPAGNKLPRSVYVLKKFFQQHSSKHTKQRYCCQCNQQLRPDETKCRDANCQEMNQEPSTLIVLKPDKAISQVLSRNWKLMDYVERTQNDVFYDIHSGEGYKQLIQPHHVGTFFNTDGISPFKSSRLNIWPIYLAFSCLPPSIRMAKANLVTCAFWVGQNKPPMDIFLRPLKTMLSRLQKVGVTFFSPIMRRKTIKLQPLFGVFDLIAKAPVLNMVQFNGSHGCPVCVHPGVWENTRLYLPGAEYPLRTNELIVRDAAKAERDHCIVNGIKGRSTLMGLVDLSTGAPTDYMHCVLEGVMKKLLGIWVETTTLPCYIGRRLKEIDIQLLKQHPPHDFSRAPRSIRQHRKFWKASELRNFMLYYSLPLLVDVLPPLYFHHFGLLVCAMHILLQKEVSDVLIQAAQDMLNNFYFLCPELYGNRMCVLNTHLLSHMAHFVKLWGPLWTHSAFGFESMNGHITSMIHSRHKIADQLLFSIDVSTTMGILSDKLKDIENEATLSFFMSDTVAHRNNMTLLFPGTYSIGATYSYNLDLEERRTVNQLTRARISRVLVFQRIFRNGTVIHSVQYGRQEGKRDSTICSFIKEGSQMFGVIQKFLIVDCSPFNVALIRPFQPTNQSILHSSGIPGREVLSTYADIDVLSSFIVQVSLQLLPVIAVPISDLCYKCVKVTGNTCNYVIKIPNNFEHH